MTMYAVINPHVVEEPDSAVHKRLTGSRLFVIAEMGPVKSYHGRAPTALSSHLAGFLR